VDERAIRDTKTALNTFHSTPLEKKKLEIMITYDTKISAHQTRIVEENTVERDRMEV